MITITIITVTYNCHDLITDTLDSVKAQTYKNFQHIFIDGKSSDGTLEKIDNYLKESSNATCISEQDYGVYDAMNKGVRLAKNDYIIFMNAGDIFADENVLMSFSQEAEKYDADIYYGDVIDIDHKRNNYKQHKRQPDTLTKSFFMRRNGLCHQSIFAKKDVLLEYEFQSKKYRFCADKDWVVYCYAKRKKFRHLNFPVCQYDRGGMSSMEKNKEAIKQETDEIIREHFGISGNLLYWVRKMKFRVFGAKI